VQCVGLVNAFGQAAGGVLLRHRGSNRFSDDLSLAGGWPSWTVAALVLLVLAGALAISQVSRLDALASDLHERLETGSTSQAPLGETEGFGPATSALTAMADQSQWLVAADAEADQIDQQEAA
jgi:hypothetical protein